VSALAVPEPAGAVLRAGLVRLRVREELAGALAPGGPQVLSWSVTLDGGTDGAAPSAADYRAAAGVLGEEQEVALVCTPDLCAHLTQTDDQLDVVAAMVAQAEAARDRLVLLDLPDCAQSAAEALAWMEALPHADIPGGFRAAAAYHPRLWVRDPFGGNAEPLKAIPPSGHVAGVISRLDRERGAHHTPANAVIYEAIDVERRFKPEEQAGLNDGGINLLRCFPGRGLQVWGGRTLARDASSRFVAHRRLIHRLVRAIRRVAAPRVFDANGPELWLAIVRAVTTVLLAAYRNGALKGTRADEAFRVRCNEKTTLPEEREQGLVVCEIEIAPAVPMEFILLRVALAGDANLDVFEP
jgi:phage tail sheath protein FI